MDVETAVLGATEDARRDEEAKGDGDDEVDGLATDGGEGPAREGVALVGGEAKVVGEGLEGNYMGAAWSEDGKAVCCAASCSMLTYHDG